MRNEKVSFVHPFSSMEDMPFCPKNYSFLKFGSDAAAQKMGHELADDFFEKYKDDIIGKNIVVIPSPYNYVRNAATVMSEHFVNKLNHHLAINNQKAVEWSIINRKVSYIKDYGFLSPDDRKKLIDGDEFYFNTDYLDDKTLIFIDDVCITGTHENKLKELMDKKGIKNDVFFLYYAKFVGDTQNANIEAALNFSGVTNVNDFIKLTSEDNYHVIVRPIKFMLNQPHEEFKIALSQFPDKYKVELYFGCISENYHFRDEYQENFKFLQAVVKPLLQ